MNIFEIEKLFEKEETLNLVLEEVSECFDYIDQSNKMFKANPTDLATVRELINKIKGNCGEIRKVWSISSKELATREAKAYIQRKMEIEENDKFTTQLDSATKKEAFIAVEPYRRIDTIIEGYIKDCEQAITVLQSHLKCMTEEMKTMNLGE
jgi:hypothetical protein